MNEGDDGRGRLVNFTAAMDDVRSNRRQRSVADVSEKLRAGLAADGVVWPDESLQSIARNIIDPNWPIRHPIKFMRERSRRDSTDSHELVGGRRGGELESADREVLLSTLSALPAVEAIEFSMTRPGEIGIFLNPWTSPVAELVQDLSSPYLVYFLDALPDSEAAD